MWVRSDEVGPVSAVSCTPGFTVAVKAVNEDDDTRMAARLRALLWSSSKRGTAVLDDIGVAGDGQEPGQAAKDEEEIERGDAHARCSQYRRQPTGSGNGQVATT